MQAQGTFARRTPHSSRSHVVESVLGPFGFIPHDVPPHEPSPLVLPPEQADDEERERVGPGQHPVLVPPAAHDQRHVEAQHERHRDRAHLRKIRELKPVWELGWRTAKKVEIGQSMLYPSLV